MIKHLLIVICLISKSWALNSGLVNYATLFLLHPEMKNYHFGVHNFFKQKDQSILETKKQIDLVLKELRKLYLFNQQRIQTARKDLYTEQLRLQKRLSPQSASWKSRLQVINLQKELELSYGEVYKNRQKEFSDRVINEIQKVFLSPTERRRKMALISSDIQKAIEVIRAKNSLDFILRSSDKLRIPVNWVQNLDIKLLTLKLEQIQGDYLRRFLNNQSHYIDLQLIEGSNHSQKEARTVLHNNIHIKSLEKYLKKNQSNNPQSVILGDVIDITQEVLRLVYQMNGFGENRFSVIATVLDQF